MRMCVDEAGDHSLAAEIDPPSVRPGQPADISVRTNRDEPIAANRDGLRDGELAVHGDDLAVGQHEVGRRLLRLRGDSGADGCAHQAEQKRFQYETFHEALLPRRTYVEADLQVRVQAAGLSLGSPNNGKHRGYHLLI